MHLQFVDSESTFAYFHAARAYRGAGAQTRLNEEAQAIIK